MIRLAVALAMGFILGELFHARPIRTVRRWWCAASLNVVTRQIRDTSEDILDAIGGGDAEGEEALTDFYILLSNERDDLRVQLAELSNP